MLTGDENIVDINFTVFWVIKDAGAYLFNVDGSRTRPSRRSPKAPCAKWSAENQFERILTQTASRSRSRCAS